MIIKWKFLTIIAFIFCMAPCQSEAANILAFVPSSSPSHLIIEMAAVRAMAERNHNITVVSVLPLKSDWLHPSMTHIKLDKGIVDMDIAINITKMKGFQKILKSLDMMKLMSTQMAEIFEDPKFQELMHNPGNKFDLMIYGYLFSDYFFGIAEHFNCPIVLVWPNIAIATILNLIGSPLAMSYTVLTILNTVSEEDMGFVFRLKNVLAVGAELFLWRAQNNNLRHIYA